MTDLRCPCYNVCLRACLCIGYADPALAMSYDTCAWTSSVTNRERYAAKTLLQAWKQEGTIDSNLFQITYYETAATLTIGEVDSSLHTGSMTYVEMRKLYGAPSCASVVVSYVCPAGVLVLHFPLAYP